MCGIIAVAHPSPPTALAPILLERFEDQRHRGTRGFGLVTIKPKTPALIERATDELCFLVQARLADPAATALVAHHRMPTSTENKIDQTHPIRVSHPDFKHDYLVVHNGIISNDDALKPQHEAAGFTYTTATEKVGTGYVSAAFNDSEAIAIELALALEQGTDRLNTEGFAAVIALQLNKKTGIAQKLFFARNAWATLKIDHHDNLLVVSSEGKGEHVPADQLHVYELGSHQLRLNVRRLEMPYRSGVSYFYPDKKETKGEKKKEKKEKKGANATLFDATGRQPIRLSGPVKVELGAAARGHNQFEGYDDLPPDPDGEEEAPSPKEKLTEELLEILETEVTGLVEELVDVGDPALALESLETSLSYLKPQLANLIRTFLDEQRLNAQLEAVLDKEIND